MRSLTTVSQRSRQPTHDGVLQVVQRVQEEAPRLRAKGHILADQYAMARRSGFDDVQIDADLAARQPEEQWTARADWQAHHYQARLRG